jgi:hypothetical protein
MLCNELLNLFPYLFSYAFGERSGGWVLEPGFEGVPKGPTGEGAVDLGRAHRLTTVANIP